METIEYRTIDKSNWGSGEWQNEPDKKQFVDAKTGLPCLVVRGPSGALCGYVGIPKGHMFHGIEYSSCSLPGAKPKGFEEDVTEETATFLQRSAAKRTVCPEDGDGWYCGHTPDSKLSVHGGVTFSGYCHEATEESFARLLARLDKAIGEAEKYPKGDAAELLKAWPAEKRTMEEYRKRIEETAICHIGEPDDVWWFGFDCAHSGDYSPKFDRDRPSTLNYNSTYRTLAYVEEQCADLASQLVSLS